VTLGDTPAIRNHQLLRGLSLPPLGVAGSPGPIATAGGLLFVTGGGSVLYAIDNRDGSVAWSADLGQTAYSTPMTYRTRGGKQFVVVATGAANGGRCAPAGTPLPPCPSVRSVLSVISPSVMAIATTAISPTRTPTTVSSSRCRRRGGLAAG